MAAIYDLNRPNRLAAPCDEENCKPPLVKILTSHEFSQLTHIAPEARAELAALELAAANFVELYLSYIIGSFSVPDKSDPTGDPDTMSFYLEADHLILIDDGDIAQKTLDKVAATGILTKPTTSHTPYAFMKHAHRRRFQLVLLHGRRHGKPRGRHDRPPCRHLVADHHELPARRHAHGLLLPADRRHGRPHRRQREQGHEPRGGPHLRAHHHPRESSRPTAPTCCASTACSFTSCIRRRSTLKQNSTMQILTIVTVMFAPLTLVTGWFGMNLTVLPGLDWPYMAATIITLALVMIVVMVLFFKRKRWL
ncbi:MAG: CorA family divalent cation transporter [Adlercreutzia equolifaciens]